MDLLIDKMTISDLNKIKDILISDFDNFWNYNIFKQELECTNSYFFIVQNKNLEILGFAGIKIIEDEADIMNIVVKKNYRNKGIGSFLLNNLISFSKKLNINIITLEVNEKNLSAIHLYKKFKFDKLGIRKKYYNGVDNGIIMSKKMKNI